jgi:prevent-host-death family protein
MKTVKASELKAECLTVMGQVAVNGEPVVITKNGKPVAELRPYTGPRAQSPLGRHKGKSRFWAISWNPSTLMSGKRLSDPAGHPHPGRDG